MDIKWFLFSFQGRINRQPFWIFVILTSIIIFGVEFMTGDFATDDFSTLTWLTCIALMWPSLAVQAKRWHDTDRSAWWILINLVPLIGGIWALVVNGFFSGSKGSNKFGPDPLEVDAK